LVWIAPLRCATERLSCNSAAICSSPSQECDDARVKDAILRAAAKSKHAKGGGLAGYLKYIADNNKELFVPLLAKALLLQERGQTANQFRAAPIV
jgi:hypothetical protein